MPILETLFNNVKKWGSEEKTNLIKGSDPESQYLKLFEELGELSKHVLKKQDCIDDLGDVLVVMIILSEQLNIDLYKEYTSQALKAGDFRNYLEYNIETFTAKQLNIRLSINLASIGDVIVSKDDNVRYLRDMFVTALFSLIALMQKLNYTVEQCLEHSYNVIKDREGIMYEGAWIKSTDPVYQTVLAVMGARRIHQ